MLGLLIRLAISALGLWVASKLVGGIAIEDTRTLVLAALLLGVVNAIVRPIVVFLTFPITIVTLGLFLWVVNAAMIGIVASLLSGFHVAGFWSALLGALIVSFTSWVASWYVGPRGNVEIMVVRR